MSKTNIRFDRERFEKALNYYGSKGLKPQTAELRLEAEFVKGNGVYSFEVNREGAKRLTETLLKRNDLFVVKGLFVGLMVETIGKEGHAPILSYPLLQTAALPTGYKAFANTDAEAVYSGKMSITTGSAVNYQGLPLRRFRYVPETQPVVVVDGETLKSAGLIPQFDMDQLLLNLPEQFAFAGTKDQKITISFPANATTDIKPVANTEKAYLVLIVDGWLIEGGTNPSFKQDNNPFASLI